MSGFYTLEKETKLRPRQSAILDMIKGEYSEIWDTCCDHGKLGMALLSRPSVNKIHFLDCVPSIMMGLDVKLALRGYEESRYQTHCMNAQDLSPTTKGSLVCICGVGGETAIEILQGLEKKNNLEDHEYLICVQHHIYQLREFLKQNGFKSKNEVLVVDKGIGYEIFLLSKNSGEEIHPVGSSIFNTRDSEHQNYIKSLIDHYERKMKSDKSVVPIVNLYKVRATFWEKP